MLPAAQNQPLSTKKKQGSKFDLQGSDTKLYRVSNILTILSHLFSLNSMKHIPKKKVKKRCGSSWAPTCLQVKKISKSRLSTMLNTLSLVLVSTSTTRAHIKLLLLLLVTDLSSLGMIPKLIIKIKMLEEFIICLLSSLWAVLSRTRLLTSTWKPSSRRHLWIWAMS